MYPKVSISFSDFSDASFESCYGSSLAETGVELPFNLAFGDLGQESSRHMKGNHLVLVGPCVSVYSKETEKMGY